MKATQRGVVLFHLTEGKKVQVGSNDGSLLRNGGGGGGER